MFQTKYNVPNLNFTKFGIESLLLYSEYAITYFYLKNYFLTFENIFISLDIMSLLIS